MMNRLMLLAAVQLGADSGFEWARPQGLWALLLPAILWVLSRLQAHPPAVATGTLALWKRVAASHPTQASGARRRTPPWIWCLIASLGLGALGLAGPRLVRPAQPRTWTVVLDHSPSTSLAFGGGNTRLDAALEEARRWLSEHMGPDDRALWLSSKGTTLELGRGELPPARWLFHPSWFAPEPRWEFFDVPGALWVTDAAPASGPEAASLVCSGGPAVPGPVSSSGTTSYVWDGERVVASEGAQARRKILVGDDVPEPVAALARLWAEERGLRVLASPERDLALELRCESSGGEVERLAQGEGWSAGVRAGGDEWILTSASPAPVTGENWLRAEEGPVLVHAAPGLVRLGFTHMDPPSGDPAAFAYSWSRLFERWLLPAPGVVPLQERMGAGEALERNGEPPPAPPPAEDGAALRAGDLDAWLAAGAALLAAAALSLGRLGR